MIKISVIVPTYNRVMYLRQALESICNQSFDKDSYEIIVVDNNSTDGTKELVAEFSSFGNVSYYLEQAVGVSHARNRGIILARAPYIVYFDDDTRVPRHWLETASQIIDYLAPALFGGPQRPYYEGAKKRWFKDEYLDTLSLGEQAHYIQWPQAIYETNFGIRRSLLESIGGFNVKLGMKGNRLGYGEGTQLQKNLYERFPQEKVYYDPRLYVYHVVRRERMSVLWNMKKAFSWGRDHCYIYYFPRKKPLLQLALLAMSEIFQCAVDIMLGMLWRHKEYYPFFQNYFVEHSKIYMYRLGALCRQIYRERADRRIDTRKSVSQNSRKE